MPKCKRIKNPCNICMQSVTLKNGLQCQGACRAWVHYKCLDYTPGKIKDINEGIIQVLCPCPDCSSTITLPKERRLDSGYNCKNEECPANIRPSCEQKSCPSKTDSENPDACCVETCKERTGEMKPTCATQTNSTTNSSVCATAGDAKPKLPMNTLEQMCTTVGKLTTQINKLMVEMKKAAQQGTCDDQRPKPKNPTPCCCPNNPRRKK